MTCGPRKGIFLFRNHADFAVLTASSELDSAPVGNLQDWRRTKIWRSESGDTSYIEVELLGTSPVITHLALIDLNITKDGEIHIEAWDDAIDGATQTVDETLPPSLYVDPQQPDSFFGLGLFGVGPFGGSPDYATLNARNVTLIPVGSVDSKYWRITLSDINTESHSMGRLYIAEAVEYEFDIAYGWQSNIQDNAVGKKSIGGQRYYQPRDSQIVIGGTYNCLRDAERTSTLLDLRRVTQSRPFIFSIYPERTDRGMTTTVYGRFTNASLRHVGANQNNLPFEIIEDL